MQIGGRRTGSSSSSSRRTRTTRPRRSGACGRPSRSCGWTRRGEWRGAVRGCRYRGQQRQSALTDLCQVPFLTADCRGAQGRTRSRRSPAPEAAGPNRDADTVRCGTAVTRHSLFQQMDRGSACGRRDGSHGAEEKSCRWSPATVRLLPGSTEWVKHTVSCTPRLFCFRSLKTCSLLPVRVLTQVLQSAFSSPLHRKPSPFQSHTFAPSPAHLLGCCEVPGYSVPCCH